VKRQSKKMLRVVMTDPETRTSIKGALLANSFRKTLKWVRTRKRLVTLAGGEDNHNAPS